MTTPAQAAANQRNAQVSTGPRTSAGKARSAQNARRHGATGTPAATRVATWFRVILDRPEAGPSDLLHSDRTTILALALAQAEVRLSIARDALHRHQDEWREAHSGPDLTASIDEADHIIASMLPGTPELRRTQSEQQAQRHRFEDGLHWLDELRAQDRLLRRYEREAQGRRDRAFAAWVNHLKAQRDRGTAASWQTQGSLPREAVKP